MATTTTKITFDEGAAASTPAAADVVIYAKSDGLMYSKDDAGVETLMSGNTATFSGKPLVLVPEGCSIASAIAIANPATNATADVGRAAPIIVPASSAVRSLWIWISSNGTGAIEWGLFDLGTTLTAATKVAGGSAAPGGTGWREIAATGAPVTVAAGAYMLIIENPAANASTIFTYGAPVAPGFLKAITTYTWDDTPDLTTGWSDSSIFYAAYIECDMNGSGTRW